MSKRRNVVFIAILLMSLLAVSAPSLRRAQAMSSQMRQEDFSIVILEEGQDLNAARDHIMSGGGRISLAMPPRVLMGWIPREAADSLAGTFGIERISYAPLSLREARATDRQTRSAIIYFNSLFSEEREAEAYAASAIQGVALVNDALPHPELHYPEYVANLPQGVMPEPAQNDSMTGTAAVCLFYVESQGGVDANEFSWTSADVTSTYNRAVNGLNWWSSQAHTYGQNVTFYVYSYGPDSAACQQPYEPIRHASGEANLWIDAIMSHLGYTVGATTDRVTAFNTWLKGWAGTTWAHSVFIGYDPAGAPATFTDGKFAQTYYGGPYCQLLLNNGGWGASNFGMVLAHETGHIFWARDECYQAGLGGCTNCEAERSAPGRSIVNGNCESCNPNAASCIMRNGAYSVCPYTQGQIGWLNCGEPNETRALATQISLDGTPAAWQSCAGAQINPASEVDWYAFTGSAGEPIRVTCRPTSSLDPKLMLYFGETPVVDNDVYGPGADETLSYTCAAEGTYYIGVAHSTDMARGEAAIKGEGVQTETGSYTLTVAMTDCISDPYEPNDTRATAYPVINLPFLGVTAEICPSYDLDWYRVYLTAGNTYAFFCNETSSLDSKIALYYGDTFLLSEDDWFGGGDETLTYTAASSGYYYVGIGYFDDLPGGGAAGKEAGVQLDDTGSYLLNISVSSCALDPYEANNTRATAYAIGSLPFSGQTVQVCPSTDQDWYRVYLTAGTAYGFFCDVTSVLDPALVLYYGDTEVSYKDDGWGGDDETISYTPASTGYYYVGVGYYGSIWGGGGAGKEAGVQENTGSYRLSVSYDCVSDPYEANNTRATAYAIGTLPFSGATAQACPATDQDWYRVYLTAGNMYTIFCDTTSSLDPALVLYNSSNTLITREDVGFSGEDETLTYTPATSGYYYVGIGYYASISEGATAGKEAGIQANTGSYVLNVLLSCTSDPYEANNTRATAYAIGTLPFSGQTAQICPATDQDWYRVSLTAGMPYTIKAVATSSIDSKIVLYNASNTLLSSQDSSGSGGDETINYTPASTGFYYIGVGFYANISEGGVAEKEAGVQASTGSYHLTVSSDCASDPYEANDTRATAYAIGTLPFSGQPAQACPSTDQDWYEVYLNSTTTYTINAVVTSSLDARIVLYNASNTLMASKDDYASGFDETLSYTPATSAWYYVGVGYYANISEGAEAGKEAGVEANTGSYALNISYSCASDPYETNNTRAAAYAIGSLPFSGQTVQVCPSTDQDWYRVSLTAGTTYTIFCDTTSSLDPEIVLYYGDTWVASADVGLDGDDETLSYTAANTGYYYIGVGYWLNISEAGAAGKDAGIQADTGSYALSISFCASDPYEANNTRATATVVASLPFTGQTAQICPSTDQDWYRVSLTAGTPYTIKAIVTSSLDAEIVVYNASNTLVTSKDQYGSGTDETISYTPASTGFYYIGVGYYANISEAAAADKGAGIQANTGSYQLTVSSDCASDPYEANNTRATATVVASLPFTGQTAQICPATDQDWYKVSLTAATPYTIKAVVTSSLDAKIVLYNASNALVASKDQSGSGIDETLNYTAASTADYYVGVGYYANISEGGVAEKEAAIQADTGSYQLTISYDCPSDPYEANDTRAAAYTITSLPFTGQTAQACPTTDQDWYKVYMTAGTIYTIFCDTTSALDPEIVLYFGDTWVASRDTGLNGDDETLSYTAANTGYYYIGVGYWLNISEAGAAGKDAGVQASTGSYILSVSSCGSDPYEANDTRGAAYAVASLPFSGQPAQICPATDQDWYRISLTAGMPYTIKAVVTSSLDAEIVLYNASNTLVASKDQFSSGVDETLSYTAASTGFYYVGVGYYANISEGRAAVKEAGIQANTGSYQLTVSSDCASDPYEANDTRAAAYAIPSLPFTGQTAQICPSTDQDWYKAYWTAGSQYTVTAVVTSTLDAKIVLYNASNTLISSKDTNGPGSDETLTYKPANTGFYYIGVGYFGGISGEKEASIEANVGSYSLNVAVDCAPDAYELNETRATAFAIGALPFSGQTAQICPAADQDWYKVALTAGNPYTIKAVVTSSLDAKIVLYNSSNALLANQDSFGSGIDETINYTPASAGDYYIGVGYYANISEGGAAGKDAGIQADTGSYQLTVSLNCPSDPYEANETRATAFAIGALPFSGQTAQICPSTDQDWYRVYLAAGSQYTFTAVVTSTLDAKLVLYNSSDILISAMDTYGPASNETITYKPANTGYYYVGAGYFGSISEGKEASIQASVGSYYLTVAVDCAPDPYELNETRATAFAIGGLPFTGQTAQVCPATDQDWYKVTLTAGTPYLIRTVVTSSLDAKIVLYNSSNALLTSQDSFGSGIDETINYMPASTGLYYVGVGYYANIAGGGAAGKDAGIQADTGSYQLTISTDCPSDPYEANDTRAAATVIPNLPFTGQTAQVCPSTDQDWYKAYWTAGSQYTVTAVVTSTLDAKLVIYNSSDVLISSKDLYGPGSDETITYKPANTGYYYIGVGYFGSISARRGAGIQADNIGSYLLSVAVDCDPDPYELNETRATAFEISGLPFTGQTAQICPSTDQDWYKVSLEAGSQYTITAVVTSMLDAKIVVYYGDTLITAQDVYGSGYDETITFVAANTGNYYIGAGYYGSISVGRLPRKEAGIQANTGSYKLNIIKN